jgi:hypothetical protein
MLCYRDMCFCPFYDGCKEGGECDRALTDEVKGNAKLSGLPIDIFTSKPSCFVPCIAQPTRDAR